MAVTNHFQPPQAEVHKCPLFVTVLSANACASSTVHSRTKRNPAGRSLSCINRIESVHCGEFSETEHSIPFMCARRICIAKKMSKTPSKSHRLAEHATNNQYEESKGGNCFLLSEPIDHFLHTKARPQLHFHKAASPD